MRAKMVRRDFLKAAALSVAAAGVPAVEVAAKALPSTVAQPQSVVPLPPLAVIALNRIAFGPKPGQFDASTFQGMAGSTDAERLASFVNWQLNPTGISDTLCESRLAAAGLTTLGKSLTQLWADHHTSPTGDRTLPVKDVTRATWIRQVYSQRQLFEAMAAFWHNHFSIYAWDYAYASATWVSYDRDVIRANALGNFRTLLGAVATSPAMLFYLDNYINKAAGPNENWAREVFELHTLGSENYLGVAEQSTVPGYSTSNPIGYVDPDVYEATDCFTGWRVSDGQDQTANTGAFLYYKNWHVTHQKLVLGHFLPHDQNDMVDGQQVLDLLASHPGTARFICRKLCRRFISDDPPQAVIDAAAAEFTAQAGASDQIARVLRVILNSDAFKTNWGDKIRRPSEVTVAMLRATNADFTPSDSFTWNYDSMNEPLFEHRSPDGYPDVRSAWTNTTSLLKRWQMALYLTENDITNITTNLISQMPGYTTANAIVDFWINRILERPMSTPEQRSRVVDFMRGVHSATFSMPATEVTARVPRMVALLLMSPDFQYR